MFCTGERVYDERLFTGPDGEHRVRVRGQIRLGGGIPMVRAAVLGAGVVVVDRMIARDALERGALEPLLPGYEPARGPSLYALYAGREGVPNKTRIFLDRLAARLAAQGASERGPVLL